jgi:hypothetical protein
MDSTTFGLTLLLVGMGGTLATLALLAGCLQLLTRMFPADADSDLTKGGPGDA